MRRPPLAGTLCAALLLAALPSSAAAGEDPLVSYLSSSFSERAALKSAFGAAIPARASGRVARLPLSGRDGSGPRARAAAGTELAAVARARGPARVLVGVGSHGDLSAVVRLLARLGARPRPVESLGVVAATAPDPALLARTLGSDRRVAFLERDRVLRTADGEAIDPETGIPFAWAFDAVNAGAALAATGGRSRRQVAVIDTGADVGHPDLAGRFAATYDTGSGGATVTDRVGHGTFVAGLISAIDGNGLGGKGVAGATRLMAVRASTTGAFRLVDWLRAVDYAVRRGADVMNLSLAGQGFTTSQGRALDFAFLNDVLPVAASGNHGADGNPLEFPAAAVGGVRGGQGIGLSVAAVKPDGTPGAFSNHNDFVSLAAPGADQSGCEHGVFSTLPRNGGTIWDDPGNCARVQGGAGAPRWGYAEGTSFAAPIAAGIAALVWQVEPKLASEQVGHVLVRSARQTLPGGRWNEFTGSGLVDGAAGVALARVYDTTPPRARGRATKRGSRTVVARVSRTRDRTERGHELAGRLRYALLVSTDGGSTFDFVVRPRRRPFRAVVRLRGRRTHRLVASVCDRNGNCGSKRLGRFTRRR